MRILAQKIADSILWNINHLDSDNANLFFINSERIIQVENVAFKICLDEQDY